MFCTNACSQIGVYLNKSYILFYRSIAIYRYISLYRCLERRLEELKGAISNEWGVCRKRSLYQIHK